MIGSIREYAKAKGLKFWDVYREIERGEFTEEVIEETKTILRIKWED